MINGGIKVIIMVGGFWVSVEAMVKQRDKIEAIQMRFREESFA